MNKFKYIILLFVLSLVFSCDVDYKENPNEPVVPPTSALLNRAQKTFMDETRDEWYSGRQMLLWVQYWNQVNYTEEDRFQYRETTNLGAWNDIYTNAQDLISIINLNTDESTKQDVAVYGSNETQIEAARVLLVYNYLHAVELWGDVPYYSYGSDNASFQANELATGDEILLPAYAKQSDIYADMLRVLKEAQAVFASADYVMDGDNFYGGDAVQWAKFANSLRLRIATRVKGVYSEADSHITEAIAAGVFESNDDNAGIPYETSAVNASPMYIAFVVDARDDFAPSYSFVELLKGKLVDGTDAIFGADPRLSKYVEANADGFYNGIPITSDNGTTADIEIESPPSSTIIGDPTYQELYMEYSEVCFLLSEANGWDQTWYEAGVRASMEKWEVETADIDAYIATLPPATEETVITQKYIALYMQPMEAWSEYRRTGYPNSLVKPGVEYTYTWEELDDDGNTLVQDVVFTFEELSPSDLTDMPYRNRYPDNEASINQVNLDAAISSNGGNTQDTKLWWME